MRSVREFIEDHGISRSFLYKLLKDGRGPRVTKIGTRTLISSEAATEWRARLDRETAQPGPRKKSTSPDRWQRPEAGRSDREAA
jgi:predicted DNA-binding transcriptional regulator AlpA